MSTPRASIVVAILAVTVPLARAAAEEACAPDARLVLDGIGTPSDELARLADLTPGVLAPESGLIRRGAVSSRLVCAGAPATPWGDRYLEPAPPERFVAVVPPRLLSTFREKSPGGGNDGLLWQGRGFSTMASGGVRARWGILSAQLAPALAWSQNDSFRTVPTGEAGDLAFENPWYRRELDLPQRFGAGPFGRASLGQSYLQLEAFGAQLGVSTENRWWGPGIRNALLLTNNAEGFPHLYLGTARPVDIWIGKLEAQLLVGQLSRSDYFRHSSSRAFNALALVYTPRWVPGLHLGLGRGFIESWESARGDAFLSPLESLLKSALPGGDNPEDNQISSVWMRWVLPSAGFELYGEFGRDDHASFAALVRVLDRTAAWTLGFQKLFPAGSRWVRVVGEIANLQSSEPPPRTTLFYTHGENLGFSHDGQLLGAWIGTGGESQYLAVDVLTRSGRIGGYVERVVRNDDIFWRDIAFPDQGTDHDVETVGGYRQVRFVGPVELSLEAALGYRENRDFMHGELVYRAALGVAVPLGGARWPPIAAPGTTARARW
jgi:hypothetical protein